MPTRARLLAAFLSVFIFLIILHLPFLRLPYYWDEAGYYIPAALDFMRHGLLIPRDTLPTGHTPLVMAYLGAVWRLFGFSEVVTRAAMILIAAATVITTYTLGRRVAGREAGLWAAALLALSPLFFAQSSLVFLDLTATLFTTLALLFALDRRWAAFALAASLAVLSKETAVVVLPAVWALMLVRRREREMRAWVFSIVPIVLLAAWALFYHSRTGFWTGNEDYLQYNLYSAFTPLHVARAFLARFAEIFAQGFNWLVVAAAVAGIWWMQKRTPGALPDSADTAREDRVFGDCKFLTLALIAVYILMLSVVGGAILPRYMLPVFPAFYALAAALIFRLPKSMARLACCGIIVCFVAAWFINPPYPFPYEDNLSYATFIHLHKRAAGYLESLPGDPVILTAWPATDELRQPALGYVHRPLRVAQVDDFAPSCFASAPRFDVLYLYSRKWDPPDNWLTSLRPLHAISRQFYDYQPAAQPGELAARFHLRLVKEFDRKGQWVKIYQRP
ncbi:MAG TPA: glycosyltransferase family 39 protein [Terriglobia bacterium]|nr:glycosyltransferase family 39 protein [Terriglobia bacterium]